MVLNPPAVAHTALDTIGNTPVVRLNRVVPEGHGQVFLKLEGYNPTGPYKDRMAKAMVEEAERRGDLRPGMTIVEASAGSTGSSAAFVSAMKNYKFQLVSSNA
jgi:cysteine synthase